MKFISGLIAFPFAFIIGGLKGVLDIVRIASMVSSNIGYQFIKSIKKDYVNYKERDENNN